MYRGLFTALVTPFRDGTIDEPAFRKLIDFQFANGVTGIVPAGTTGESPTLSHEEHRRLIALSVEFAAGRGPVIAGTGSNSTAEAIDLTAAAEEAGCEAVLQVCPYYNKPSQEGLFQHFRAIAESTSAKIVLYSIPGRSGVEIGVETTARLAEACPNIVCMKEAGGSVERVSQLLAACPPGFTVLSGDDSLTLPFLAAGATGVISVASNLVPKVMSDLVDRGLAGDFEAARAIHRQYYPLFSAFLRLDTNPVPVKTAMALAGRVELNLRLPLVPMDEAKTGELRRALVAQGVL